MALKKETIELIAKLTKTKVSDIETAIKATEEVELAIDDKLQTLTTEELETRDTTQKKEGEKAGREIGVKEFKKAAGLPEDAPAKDPVKVVQAIIDKAVADAKVKPDEKVTQLTEQITLLQTQLTAKDSEIIEAKKTADTVTLDAQILKSFPKERDSKLSDDDYLTLIKATHQFKNVDGTFTVEKDGKPIRNPQTTNPLPLGEAIASIFTEKKWVGEGQPDLGGRGGGNGGGAIKFTKLSEVKKHFEDQKKSTLGDEFSSAVEKAVAELKEFDMNS